VKLTKSQLKRIVKEELEAVLNEDFSPEVNANKIKNTKSSFFGSKAIDDYVAVAVGEIEAAISSKDAEQTLTHLFRDLGLEGETGYARGPRDLDAMAREIKIKLYGRPTVAGGLYEEEIEEKKKTKVSKPGQERVSKKIAHLIGDEGKSKEQAAAIAYSMEDRGDLK